MNEETPKIEQPYLLVCPIPHYLHADGSIWLDRLWHHDLAEHLTYLRDLTLLSPRLAWPAGGDLVRLDPPVDADFSVVPIPALDSMWRILWRLPGIVAALWSATGRAAIVQSGIAGWPIPIGWIANPITLLRGRKLLLVVESAFWRIPEGQRAALRVRLRCALTELLGRFFVNRAHLLLFTQPSYRASLLTTGKGKAFIIPATWINEGDVLSDQEAERHWDQKAPASVQETKVLFAGRLDGSKGIGVLLAALRKLDSEGVDLRVDVIGDGPARAECVATGQSLKTVRMSVFPPVPYGSAFFQFLRRYHAVVVPSLSDEQPRVVFDAFSQAVPVLSSRTDGLTPHVIEGRTGRLFEPGDADSLAAALRAAATDVAGLRQLGKRGLAAARNLTHREMHRTRARILAEFFEAS